MKVLTTVRLGIAMAAIFAAGTTFAQGPGTPVPQGPGGSGPGGPGFGVHRPPMERAMRGDHGRWWNNPQIAEKLNLTEDQKKSMDVIFQQHREQLVDLRATVEKAEIEMDPLVKADQPNESAVMAQIDKVAQARAELEKANARFLFELRAKLTPDQWKQVQEFRQSHEGMHQMRRGGAGRTGDGSDHSTPPPPPGPQGMLEDGGPGEKSFAQPVNQ